MTGEDRLCRNCGAPLRSDADGEVCPRCVMGLALEGAGGGAAEEDAIGPYRLIRPLGRGGMGEVWLAGQVEPVRRQVALKIIRRGLDSEPMLRRFESEAQALAGMDHPAIARIFDAGITPTGRPFFVMEHVDGPPITDYCDRHRLSTVQRLRLFRSVCAGVQHAHQRAIIHRDLKPSNVLVAGEGDQAQPKIIDFGVARAIDQPLSERAIFTETGVLVGTPEYMSPEQASGVAGDIDTRTDVYSLGVLLYELLVGTVPFDPSSLRSAGYEGLMRVIRLEEPSRPSARVSTLGEGAKGTAERRRTNPESLSRQLHGDLDWITLKALAKERARRYGSPEDLARDIERHLNHQPVSAGPPGAAYRMRKFVRRHRAGAIAASAALAMLVVGLIGTTWGLVRARRAEALARQKVETEAEVRRFLIDLFEVTTPENARGEELTAREVLANGLQRIETELRDQPEVRAHLLHILGEIHHKLGLLDEAERLSAEALEMREAILGPDHPETLLAMDVLGAIELSKGDYDAAEALFRRSLEIGRRAPEPDRPGILTSLHNTATVLFEKGDLAGAESIMREVVDGRRRVLGPDDPALYTSLHYLGAILRSQARAEEAEPFYREALEGHRRLLGDDHPSTLVSISSMGFLMHSLGRLEEAERYFRMDLESTRRIMGPDHPDTLYATNNLGALLRIREDFEGAEKYLRLALDGRRRVLGPDHALTWITGHNLGSVLLSSGRSGEAGPLLRDAVVNLERILGDRHLETANAWASLGAWHEVEGRNAEAERWYRRAIGALNAAVGPDHPKTKSARDNLDTLLVKMEEGGG